MTIIAVTGLTKEAKIVGVAGVVAVAGGGDGDGLAAKLDALHGDIRGVISIGLAGALSPHLKVGDVVIADAVMTGAELWHCHEAWRVRLLSRLPHAHQGQIVRQRRDHRECRHQVRPLRRDRRAGGGHGIPGRRPLRRARATCRWRRCG